MAFVSRYNNYVDHFQVLFNGAWGDVSPPINAKLCKMSGECGKFFKIGGECGEIT